MTKNKKVNKRVDKKTALSYMWSDLNHLINGKFNFDNGQMLSYTIVRGTISHKPNCKHCNFHTDIVKEVETCSCDGKSRINPGVTHMEWHIPYDPENPEEYQKQMQGFLNLHEKGILNKVWIEKHCFSHKDGQSLFTIDKKATNGKDFSEHTKGLITGIMPLAAHGNSKARSISFDTQLTLTDGIPVIECYVESVAVPKSRVSCGK